METLNPERERDIKKRKTQSREMRMEKKYKDRVGLYKCQYPRHQIIGWYPSSFISTITNTITERNIINRVKLHCMKIRTCRQRERDRRH